MYDLSKYSDTKLYFDFIMSKVQNTRVKSIFSLDCPFWNTHIGYRVYSCCERLYIMFENDMCLVIRYLFIDDLDIEYRKLTEEELLQYDKLNIKDYFNGSQDIYHYDTDTVACTETVKLDYSDIREICIRKVKCEYEKWIDGDLEWVMPTDETFDEIKFIMSNGNSFTVCADDAYVDGYVQVWSEDAECSS